MNDADKEAIASVIASYRNAFLHANSSHLMEVFHPDCSIQGIVGGEAWVGDRDALATFCDSNPPGSESGMEVDYQILDAAGDSAAVKAEVSNYHGIGFVDFLAMQKTDGKWWVVGKAFSST